MKWLAILPLVSACDFIFRVDPVPPADAHPPINSLPDGGFVLPDAGDCAGTTVGGSGPNRLGLFQACVPSSPPHTDYTLPPVFDTDSSQCDAVKNQIATADLCVVLANNITVAGPIALSGGRALVLAAAVTIEVHGTLDVSSHINALGPGAMDHLDCLALTGGDGSTGGGGGGGGGGFGTHGASGGDASGTGAGSGGRPGLMIPAERVRGGCPGANGGRGTAGAPGGAGGAAGGAVYLMAGAMIHVDGMIAASGSGGMGGGIGVLVGGGGGAGAGGLIGLDAPSIRIDPSAVMIANGGGGGGGGGTMSGTGNGGDPNNATYVQPALGGSRGGGVGGNGAAGTTAATKPASGAKTGGGGGGGQGYILIYTTGPSPLNVPSSPQPYVNNQ